jgi:hypothetical protein
VDLSGTILGPSDGFIDIGKNLPSATPVMKYDLVESTRVDHRLAANYGNCDKGGLFSLNANRAHTDLITVKYVRRRA